MNLIWVVAFTSLINTDMAHNRQTVNVTKVWDSGELVSKYLFWLNIFHVREGSSYTLSPA